VLHLPRPRRERRINPTWSTVLAVALAVRRTGTGAQPLERLAVAVSTTP
jgi:hypothetical protein